MRMTRIRYNLFAELASFNRVPVSHLSTESINNLLLTSWIQYLGQDVVSMSEDAEAYDFDGYLMLLRNLGKVEYGRNRVEYIFVTPENRTLFSGKDYSHAFNDAIGDDAALALLAMLCDNPDESGGTFDHYTSAQKAFGRSADARELEYYCEGY